MSKSRKPFTEKPAPYKNQAFRAKSTPLI